MAGVQRLLRTTSRTILPSLASSRALAHRPCGFLTSTRYTSTAVNASPSPVNSETPPNSVDPLPDVKARDGTTDWSRSYAGLSVQPFSNEVAETLQAPIDPLDVEVKPGKHWNVLHYFRSLLIFPRRPFIFAWNKIQKNPQQGVWSRRLGTRTS